MGRACLYRWGSGNRILANFFDGGSHGCCSAPPGFLLSCCGTCSAVGRCAHYRYFCSAIEDVYGPAAKRELVGAIPADGGGFVSLCVYRGPENRVSQDHGEPDAGAAQSAGAPGEPTGCAARSAAGERGEVY